MPVTFGSCRFVIMVSNVSLLLHQPGTKTTGVGWGVVRSSRSWMVNGCPAAVIVASRLVLVVFATTAYVMSIPCALVVVFVMVTHGALGSAAAGQVLAEGMR